MYSASALTATHERVLAKVPCEQDVCNTKSELVDEATAAAEVSLEQTRSNK